jgi:hypothetical protein
MEGTGCGIDEMTPEFFNYLAICMDNLCCLKGKKI